MEFLPITPADRQEVNDFIASRWYTLTMIIRGEEVDMTAVEGFLLREQGELTGLVTFLQRGDELEITSLDSTREGRGVGAALLERVALEGRARGCRRLRLVATNDNMRALAFYQKRGFDLFALRRGALDLSRRLKPEIPLVGEGGIPLRHELELELLL